MRLADARRTVYPTAINASAARAKIHNGRPVKGSFDEATVPPSRVVVPSTPPAGLALAFVGESATVAPLTPPAEAGFATTRAWTADFVFVTVVCCADWTAAV